MEGIINTLLGITPFSIILLGVIYLFKLFDKKFDNHELDKALTPSWQNLLEQLMILSIASIIISFIIWVESQDLSDGNLQIQFASFLIEFAFIFIVVILYIGLLTFISISLNYIFCGRVKYFIEIEEEGKREKWQIEKTVSKNTLYLSRDNIKYKYFYEGSLKLFSEQSQSEKVIRIYSKLENIKAFRILASILFLSVVCINIYFYFTLKEYFLYSLILSFIILIPIFSFINGLNFYENNKDKIQNQGQSQE